MSRDQSHMTERMLNLTMEIIYLLTGEKYAAVKMATINALLEGMWSPLSEGWNRNERPVTMALPQSLISGNNNKKKILEVTNKMIELLSGEVPVKCQDVNVSLSVEAMGNLEEQTDPHKNVKVENHQTLTSPGGSSNRNSPERSPSPHCSQDSSQEEDCSQQHNQSKDQITVKIEVLEDEDETYERSDELHEDEFSTAEGQDIRRTSEEQTSSPAFDVDYSAITKYFSGENPGTPSIHFDEYSPSKSHAVTANVQPGLHGMNRPLHPSHHMGLSHDNLNFATSDIYQEPHIVDRSSGPANLEESLLKSSSMIPNVHQGLLTEYGPSILSNHEESSSSAMVQPTDRGADNVYSCSDSWKSLPILGYQHEHQRTQKCDQPHKSLNYKSVSGQKKYLGKKVFPCTECGKCFTYSLELIKHQQEHRKVRPYSCLDCGRSYTQKSHLLNHQRLHTGVNTFPCLQCGRCFTLKSQFIQHMRSHTGEKPFSCTECGRCFAKKSTLDNHQTVHTGNRPFSCSVCGKRLARKATLRQHLRTHVGDV
ncbi:oocyte zinc finger protein XlCOF7.1-like [Hyperolius riggenbachi]|uniref:oocyte zinc finger protein XlCOF7.1-like n=1 Tax=Hyperolius riggenbachi TaxID=752182 RepID=UPI0035A30299